MHIKYEEIKIIRNYKKYNNKYADKWSLNNLGNFLIKTERDEYLNKFIKKLILKKDVSNLKVLDIGCSEGNELARLKKFGFLDKNLFGIDINPKRINKANKNYPMLNLYCRSATKTKFKNQNFDIIILYTVFSSILNNDLRFEIAKEIKRILKKGGILIIYDMRYPNPFNKNIMPLLKKKCIGYV